MIPIPLLPAPSAFERMASALQPLLVRHYAKRKSAQVRFDFDPHLARCEKQMIETLVHASRGKCAYCETPLTRTPARVNAFRPYAGVEEANGAFHADHYWRAALAWGNYFASCHLCARYKSTRFPVAGTRAQPDADAQALAAESALLIDPREGDIGPHLRFEPGGNVLGLSERGRSTIEILGLNRKELVAARAAEWRRFQSADAARAQALLDEAQPFVAMKRQLHAARQAPVAAASANTDEAARAVHQAFETARAQVSTEQGAGLENYRARARFIERVQIRNFLSIEQLELDLVASESERAPCFALLGENAVGKSSVLKAIALALGGARYAERLGLGPRELLRRGAGDGCVKVWISGFEEPATLEFRRRGQQLRFGQEQSRSLVLGYGSSRLLPTARRRPRRGMRHAKIDGLFDPFLPLADAQAWLLGSAEPVFDEAALRIKDLLLLPAEARLVRVRGRTPGVFVEYQLPHLPGAAPVRTPLAQMSDGYQSMLGLAADLMAIMFAQGFTSMSAAQGVVLIDELGNHLHPRWRMQIVGRLRKAFPAVQFLFSTHDPLCLRGMLTGEIVVLELDAQRSVYALTDLPSAEGMRVDQLLCSEHFGLGSSVDPALQSQYERYLALKRLDRRGAAPDAARQPEIEQLQQQLFGVQAIATSPQERVALEFMNEARMRGPAAPARTLSVAGLQDDAKAELHRLFDAMGGTA